MNSQITESFLDCYRQLPEEVRELARRAYRLWRENSMHPSLHYKCVQEKERIFSVRVGRGWRTLGILEGETMTWFWVGSHADYDKIINA